ncbi:hypothetical protein C8R45DRAFT_410486 [Mycena sanguinolenta]|nr:hypothetical protein C8R45DRAFT_410486 [Mycena sanguinolenta]
MIECRLDNSCFLRGRSLRAAHCGVRTTSLNDRNSNDGYYDSRGKLVYIAAVLQTPSLDPSEVAADALIDVSILQEQLVLVERGLREGSTLRAGRQKEGALHAAAPRRMSARYTHTPGAKVVLRTEERHCGTLCGEDPEALRDSGDVYSREGVALLKAVKKYVPWQPPQRQRRAEQEKSTRSVLASKLASREAERDAWPGGTK